MAIVTGDRYLENLVRFVDGNAGPLIDGTLVLKLNPAGLHYVQSRLEALSELEGLLAGAPVDYLRAYVSDLGDHRALEQLRRILRLLTSLKVVSVLAPPARDPTPLSLAPFGRLKVLELRGCDLSTSAAKGLLELRHTLERIVCHNSTDALRHVFASRIAEIKDSPQWNRLSFVSCACNGLLLMDESLQLLPAVETLDLSRNKFTKVDNLRKCLKLKHLDLGFNNLRTVSSFSQVSCNIVKLVLRNNALTTLHGIENLKSLEDLDVSYNIISNFSELEFLVGLPSLGSLWLEGNPLCCARWYRPQAFSYINHPEKFKLDNKEISTREFWKRQLIIASRQKRPASFGFYSPAVYDTQGEGSNNRRQRKTSRLASIGGEGESNYLYSDQDSTSIDNEVQSREETVLSDDNADIVLMNKVEQMKKERSVLWLRDFKEWMDHASENLVDHGKYSGTTLFPGQENLSTKTSEMHVGEILRCAPDSVHVSGLESGKNVVESDSAFMDISAGLHGHRIGSMGTIGGLPLGVEGRMDLRDKYLITYPYDRMGDLSAQTKSSGVDASANQVGYRMVENASISPLTTVDSISESHSSAPPGSPPHYRKDILQRRQCLEDEFLFSEDSYSAASSDSNTSCSEDDACAFGPMSDVDQLLNETFSNTNRGNGRDLCFDTIKDKYYGQRHQISHVKENGQCSAVPFADKTAGVQNVMEPYESGQSSGGEDPETHDGEIPQLDEKSDLLNNNRGKRKTKRRVVLLRRDSNLIEKIETSQKLNVHLDVTEAEKEQWGQICGSHHHGVDGNKRMLPSTGCTHVNDDALGFPASRGVDNFIENHFNSTVADSRNRETCHQYMRCYCMLEQDSLGRERDVALVQSNQKKLYIMLIGAADDKSGTILRLLACHRVEDIKEILVGIGLQVVRVSIEKGLTYLFMTRSIEKSMELFCLLEVFNSLGTDSRKCSLRSLEQVQINLFEKQIFGGSKISIFQYAMVLFQNDDHDEDSWLPRSLFVAGVHLLLCVEDLKKFGSLLVDSWMPSYFSLNAYCCITDVSEMVVDAKENCYLTLTLAHPETTRYCLGKAGKEAEGVDKAETASDSVMWKLKWFSDDSVSKFVTLVKAIRAGTDTSPLSVRCIS